MPLREEEEEDTIETGRPSSIGRPSRAEGIGADTPRDSNWIRSESTTPCKRRKRRRRRIPRPVAIRRIDPPICPRRDPPRLIPRMNRHTNLRRDPARVRLPLPVPHSVPRLDRPPLLFPPAPSHPPPSPQQHPALRRSSPRRRPLRRPATPTSRTTEDVPPTRTCSVCSSTIRTVTDGIRRRWYCTTTTCGRPRSRTRARCVTERRGWITYVCRCTNA
mmetsp:Transcript_41511/g.125789  ORF Transcript_41511/g.125789 Transcript_41511/m.125789 type:complete len:218 (+) Transcript_41511:373-1026(+)